MHAASLRGLIASEWPSISSLCSWGARLVLGAGEVISSRELEQDTHCCPSPGHGDTPLGAGAQSRLAPSHVPQCHGHMALVHCDVARKGHWGEEQPCSSRAGQSVLLLGCRGVLRCGS